MSKMIIKRPTPRIWSRRYKHYTEMATQAQAQLEKMRKELEQRLRLTKVTCVSCHKSFPIKDATWKDSYHYVRPFSCEGGDYWRRSISSNNVSDCDHVCCPLCGHDIYVYSYPEREALLALRPYAAERVRDERS